MSRRSTQSSAHECLKNVFGYSEFRLGQEEVINNILAGDNVLTIMPTGSGKSLCFQIPALVLDGLTLVVSPLVALMEDQVAALQLDGISADSINSSRTREENVRTWVRVTAGYVRLLYISPELLMTERMLTALRRLNVVQIAIDEAHCISSWGPSFRPDYEDLSRLQGLFCGVPLVALTATADESTRLDILEKLFKGQGQTVVTGFDRPNIRLAVDIRYDWRQQLLEFVQARPGVCGIVYCLSRKKTEVTTSFLQEHGIRAIPYHAGLDSAQRGANQEIFMNEAGVVMVATIAFGMGVDKPDVRYVFHSSLPGNLEAYYQELGRAGRDGEPADAFMLYGLDDIRQRRLFIQEAHGGDDYKRREHKRLDALISYCEAPRCRRCVLLSYFGDASDPCNNCDICLDPPIGEDGTALANVALSVILQTGQRFGATHVIDVLLGVDTEKIRKFKHNHLSVYAQGVNESRNIWRSILRQLVASDFLNLDISGYGGLSLTKKGQLLLQNTGEFWFLRDPIRSKAVGARKSDKSISTLDSFSVLDAELLAELKKLRKSLAIDREVPAYVIFSDRSLIDMAEKRPISEIEFAEIYGVGKAKLRDFSKAFLALIAQFSK